MDFARPNSVPEILDLLAQRRWRILAGGTDFYPAQRERPVKDAVLDVTGATELRSIRYDDGHWRIGALSTWSDLLAADLPPAFDSLKLAAREVGSIQIQNRATVVGNVCNASPAADGIPPLLTLDARMTLASAAGTRELPLSAFVVGNRKTLRHDDEMVTEIVIPATSTEGRSTFLKLGSRRYLVISISMIACRLVFGEGGRIGSAAVSVGACSAVAQRLPEFEARLAGIAAKQSSNVTPSDAEIAALLPIDDVRGTAEYRRLATIELVKAAIDGVTKEYVQ